jgi:nucleotide-binding universal stress UspA family protein
MRILAAVDSSPCSREVLRELASRPWPAGSEIRLLSVSHPTPWIHDPWFVGTAIRVQDQEREEQRAAEDVERCAREIREAVPDLRVSTATLSGSPPEKILEEADTWKADLVLVGTHGYGPAKRLIVGSVAQTVALHARCSVEIVRHRAA